MSKLLWRGLAAGAAAGLALALFLLAVGEKTITRAIQLEKAAHAGEGHTEMFSRGTQQAGGALGALIMGAFFGLVFAVVYAGVRPRMRTSDDWRAAISLAAVAYVTLGLVPLLKYPPNPPGVGDEATIGKRTALYLVLLAWSIVSAWASWRVARWLRQRGRAEHAVAAAHVGCWVVLVTIAFVAFPGNPDPLDAPALLIWRFRVASAGGTLVLWTVMGALFGWLSLRQAAAARAERIPTG